MNNLFSADEHIITIRKQSMQRAQEAFCDLMKKTERMMNEDAMLHPQLYKNLSPGAFEKHSVGMIKIASQNTPFRADEIRLVSGRNFPDIIAEKYYGVEVKMTQGDHWTSLGSSIVESSRNEWVEDIYLLFGKMGGRVPEFRCKPYEDVMSEISVTHSPRYQINMSIRKDETIFAKMGVSYEEFRKADDSIDQVRRYYRMKALREHKEEMPWWITSDNLEVGKSMNIRLWKSLSIDEKYELTAKGMILFTEILNPKSSPSKYNRLTLWLCSYRQVVMPNVRDLFTAGGTIKTVNGRKLRNPIPQVFAQIIAYADVIRMLLTEPTYDLLLMIKDYNELLLDGKSLWSAWLGQCQEYANQHRINLQKWIEEKPEFTF